MLNASYEAILSELLSAEVRFLVIGGYAMAALGLPRFTNDLDIWVHSESPNIKSLYRALRQANVPMDAICEDDLLGAYNFLEIGQAPVKVDIITNLGDFSFERAWSIASTSNQESSRSLSSGCANSSRSSDSPGEQWTSRISIA